MSSGRRFGSDGGWDSWRGEYGPRRPAQGIRAETRRGPFGKTWWAGRWLRALEKLVDEGRLSRGRTYARGGQVISLEVGKDGVHALVQGSQPSPYRVQIDFRRLTDAEWEQVYATMASEAVFAARLLSGEMPAEIENAFAAAGAPLFPEQRQDLVSECSCPDMANPCKHLAAVFYLLGERFDADPFLMFELRGRTGEEVATALRVLRGGTEEPAGNVEPAEAEVPLLAGDPDAFWLPRAPLPAPAGFDPPMLNALAVKSLGPPPFWNDPRSFGAVMDELYRTIAARAHSLALGDEVSETAI